MSQLLCKKLMKKVIIYLGLFMAFLKCGHNMPPHSSYIQEPFTIRLGLTKLDLHVFAVEIFSKLMKDIGDDVKNKDHLDPLGLEIPDNDKQDDDKTDVEKCSYSAASVASVLCEAPTLMSVTVRGTG